MEAEYHNPNPTKTPNTRRYRGVSYPRPITTAKELVRTIDLAERLCGPGSLRRAPQKRWRARCPLPDHPDKSPSFVVYLDTNSWHCFGCGRGGDVVDLARHAFGYRPDEMAMAAAEVLAMYGHEVPKRPDSWFRKQDRQRKTRDLLREAKVEALTRRMWRYLVEPIVAGIEDDEERLEEAERLWAATQIRAREMVLEREDGKA